MQASAGDVFILGVVVAHSCSMATFNLLTVLSCVPAEQDLLSSESLNGECLWF